MAFKVFEKGSAPASNVPSATIQKRGLISLNRAAFGMIGSPDAVELLWDADRQVVGLRPSSPSNPNAYPARPQSQGSSKGPILIAGSLFTRYIGLDTTEARRWVPSVEDGVLCLDLTTPGQRVRSNRSKPVEETGQ